MFSAQYPNFSYGVAPLREDGWGLLGPRLRLALDYLRYLTPEYQEAPKLRRRAQQGVARIVVRTARGGTVARSCLRWALRLMDRSIPRSAEIDRFIDEHRPDLLLVTPVVREGSPQSDYVRSARARGVRTVFCVASWDNLTNKGLIHDQFDLVTVWNEAMKREAVELHGVPPARVAVTGAQSFDEWFGRRPSTTREAFCARVGLRPDRPYLLYVCSSSFVAPHETPFIRTWVAQLREAPAEALRQVGVLVRPHPQNWKQWRNFDASGMVNVAIYPPLGAVPVDPTSKNEYFDSIHHSAAVIAVNTSAEIESAIVGRKVFSLLAPEFRETQEGTLHFHHLMGTDDGLLYISDNFPEHLAQLDAALRDGPVDADDRSRRFVEMFVRPYGVRRSGEAEIRGSAGDGGCEPRAARRGASDVGAARATVSSAVGRDRAAQGDDRRSRKGEACEGEEKAARRSCTKASGARTAAAHRSTDVRCRGVAIGVLDPMKILFVMRSTIYVRNFESTIRLLAERGHEVHIVAEPHWVLDPGNHAGRLAAEYPGIVHDHPPAGPLDGWALLSEELRRSAHYLRYLRPEYRNAPKLRRRSLSYAPPFILRATRHAFIRSATGLVVARHALRLADGALPINPVVFDFVREHNPDLLIVTPLVEPGLPESQYLRAARALGIRTVLCVHSWDNLTNKGLIQDPLDLVTVWNEPMKREAVGLHGVPRRRVEVTGAPNYDHWFEWAPRSTREEFCRRVGLPADRPYLLYLCSSKFIAPHEMPFVRRWIEALRSASAALAGTGVLIRPHPQWARPWRKVDFSDLKGVAIWPREGANPVDGDSRADYYDSIFHSAAVVGVNTSGQIESAIIGRGVYTLLAPEFRDTQEGTLHFQYLRSGLTAACFMWPRRWTTTRRSSRLR